MRNYLSTWVSFSVRDNGLRATRQQIYNVLNAGLLLIVCNLPLNIIFSAPFSIDTFEEINFLSVDLNSETVRTWRSGSSFRPQSSSVFSLRANVATPLKISKVSLSAEKGSWPHTSNDVNIQATSRQPFTHSFQDTLPPVAPQPFTPSTRPDTLPFPPINTDADSLPFPLLDTLPEARFVGNTRQFQVSKDSLAAAVDYSAEDSMHVDFVKEEIHLFGNANVKYDAINLTANHIVLNWGNSIVMAEPLPDSIGQPAGLPTFTDGGQEFTSKRMRYNFKTSKGIIYDAVTTQDDIVVRGGKTKFLSGAYIIDDTTSADIIYAEGGLFTTCTDDHPHFGFRTARAKIIPNQLAVVGATNLEIMGVPTPLWLPFGFFPLKSGRSTGLLFGDYEYSPQWGYGLRDIGWFFPLGEHVNLELRGDYYIKGTYAIGASGNYRRRYKYSGNFSTRFNRQRQENTETGAIEFQPSFSIRWSHRQDPAAHPTANFGGSINFQTNRAQSRVYNSYQAVSQNVINSNLNFTKRWDDKPFTLTAGLSHNQNNQSQEITVNFPQVQFQTSTMYPFRRKAENRTGKDKWYELINLRYRNELRGTFTGYYFL